MGKGVCHEVNTALESGHLSIGVRIGAGGRRWMLFGDVVERGIELRIGFGQRFGERAGVLGIVRVLGLCGVCGISRVFGVRNVCSSLVGCRAVKRHTGREQPAVRSCFGRIGPIRS